MAKQERYTIGPGLLRDIRSTIQKVDALAPHASGPTQDTRYWGMQAPQRVNVFQICSFTGSWSIGQERVVKFKYQTATPNTVVATNLFCSIAPDGTCDVSIAKAGTAWYLVQPDWTSLPGYSAFGNKVLAVQNGFLRFLDTTACST